MEEIINLFEDKNWTDAPEYFGGSRKKVLHDEYGVKTVLLELPEGFYMSSHAHITAEQHFVLKDHGPFESQHGAMVLVIWYPSQVNS